MPPSRPPLSPHNLCHANSFNIVAFSLSLFLSLSFPSPIKKFTPSLLLDTLFPLAAEMTKAVQEKGKTEDLRGCVLSNVFYEVMVSILYCPPIPLVLQITPPDLYTL